MAGNIGYILELIVDIVGVLLCLVGIATWISWSITTRHTIEELRQENLWLKSHWRKHD